jgi:hypothetical protein
MNEGCGGDSMGRAKWRLAFLFVILSRLLLVSQILGVHDAATTKGLLPRRDGSLREALGP